MICKSCVAFPFNLTSVNEKKHIGITTTRHAVEFQRHRGNVWYFDERLIYLRLKSKKKSIVVFGRDMLNAVQKLKNFVQSLIQGKMLDEEVADSLIRYSQFPENFIALDNANEKIVFVSGRRSQ